MNADSLGAAGLVVEARVHVCKSCAHKTNGRRCCADYAVDNRIKLNAVQGLELVVVRGGDDTDELA
jgi:hypothetical protein